MPDPFELPTHRTCGTPEVHQRHLQDREYQRRRLEIERHIARFLLYDLVQARTGITRIPVVVHVVLPDPSIVSDAQVRSQIDVLNRDYRATNPDVSRVPAVWKGLVGDARLQFGLASVDPSGAPTSGITRTVTNVPSFGTDESVKVTRSGGIDPWDPARYLNVWVCQLGGGLLGYAQFPGGSPETDGVVILHSAFGTSGTATAPFNLGRTTTHEIGHYLNLHHIWGDRLDCSGTDDVDDTPPARSPNYGKPSFPHVSCNNGPNGDMFMNYMDYVDDDAMFVFTQGQVARMAATLDGPRSELGKNVPVT